MLTKQNGSLKTGMVLTRYDYLAGVRKVLQESVFILSKYLILITLSLNSWAEIGVASLNKLVIQLSTFKFWLLVLATLCFDNCTS